MLLNLSIWNSQPFLPVVLNIIPCWKVADYKQQCLLFFLLISTKTPLTILTLMTILSNLLKITWFLDVFPCSNALKSEYDYQIIHFWKTNYILILTRCNKQHFRLSLCHFNTYKYLLIKVYSTCLIIRQGALSWLYSST